MLIVNFFIRNIWEIENSVALDHQMKSAGPRGIYSPWIFP